MTKSGWKVMGIANVGHKKRIALIRHLLSMGIAVEGVKQMNATDEEIKEAVQE